ncbi:dephospho-CoA kinase [Paenimyroides ummariense]|uniref:Dephospho-CoA kinase n=1 Tax=Paenimyroides ummariense TaxID=913024 RepID=A0A1I5G2Y8_9FLAO|nr:dephospho-CoA kinase [Paenimyroides ummariense]SFO30387.1 dephospho-CoA kinase [Paenimyroides ummariense]
MMKIIGVTGGIGSGKTTIINYIKEKGFAVYIADDAGKKVMQKPEIIQQINELFNKEVLLEDGFLDRSKIASLVFTDNDKLQQLNNIVHPAVGLDFEEFKKENSNEKVIFKETAVLFESGSYKKCDATILITAPLEIRIQRVMQRDNITKEQVESRIKNQLSDDEKAALATYIVENIDLKQAFKSIDDIITKILIN